MQCLREIVVLLLDRLVVALALSLTFLRCHKPEVVLALALSPTFLRFHKPEAVLVPKMLLHQHPLSPRLLLLEVRLLVQMPARLLLVTLCHLSEARLLWVVVDAGVGARARAVLSLLIKTTLNPRKEAWFQDL
jgi:hypothetical protein